MSHFFLLFYFQIANSSRDGIARLTNNDSVAEMISQCDLQMVLTVLPNVWLKILKHENLKLLTFCFFYMIFFNSTYHLGFIL